jgi:hypothetical protein
MRNLSRTGLADRKAAVGSKQEATGIDPARKRGSEGRLAVRTRTVVGSGSACQDGGLGRDGGAELGGWDAPAALQAGEDVKLVGLGEEVAVTARASVEEEFVSRVSGHFRSSPFEGTTLYILPFMVFLSIT